MEDNAKQHGLDWKIFGPKLDDVVTSAINLVDRGKPGCLSENEAAALLVESILRITDNTHRTIRFIAADIPDVPSRKPEYALAIGPLARTILDSLFTLVFAFQDLPARAGWFMKSGWREMHEEHQRFADMYSQDARFKEWIAEHEKHVIDTASHWGVTTEQRADPSKIPYWPIPSQMLRGTDLEDSRRDLLEHLHAWFYKSLSCESHLSLSGLVARGVPLFEGSPHGIGSLMRKQKSNSLMTTVQIVLSLVSEIDAQFQLGLAERLAYVWTIQIHHSIAASELYDMRYQELLHQS